MHTEQKTRLLDSYRKEIHSYDEVLDSNGHSKPYWNTLFETLEKLGIAELENRQQEIINTLRENGVTYNVYGSPDGLNRPWQLDPIPFLISHTEWQQISKGLQQRAHVLNLLLKDLYGPQTVVKNGILPAELVFANTGFLRSCFDVRLPGEHQLLKYAVDMARGPDNRMWIVDNRTQAPSGSGYTLENRSVISSVLPELADGMYIKRLSPFFTSLQQTIAHVSNKRRDTLNVVYLTPGPNNETYFEHAYLASYMGYTLVQGEDLLVRDGFVWLKSINGLEKVDVIIRRVDDDWCDPLELREDSRLGIPGLLHAIRLGHVQVINPPGTSILENHGMMAFLYNICQYFLGEELLLPSVATWWCGQPSELTFVLENLHRLIIKKANRKQKFRSVYGKLLSKNELDELRKAILANPIAYVAQEEISLSTTPSFINGKIEPRYAALRAFLVANETGGYTVMPGGLTRSSPTRDRLVFSNQSGGIAKDTWIVSSQQEQVQEKIIVSSVPTVHKQVSLPSRSAENLFWVGRYCERTLATATFLNHTLTTLNTQQHFGGASLNELSAILLRSLTHLTLTYPGFVDESSEDILYNPYPKMIRLVADSSQTGSIAANIESFLRVVISVRERWTTEIWHTLDMIESSHHRIRSVPMLNQNSLPKILDKLQSRLFAFYGILSETMPRDSGFLLLEAGKLIERCLSQISVMRSMLAFRYEQNLEDNVLEKVLLNHHLLEKYRLMYRSQLSIESLLDMVLQDDKLPYALLYQLNALSVCLENLPKSMPQERLNAAQKAILEASTRLILANIADLCAYDPETSYRKGLDNLLSDVSDLVASVSVSLTNMYFSHTVIQHSFSNTSDGTTHAL